MVECLEGRIIELILVLEIRSFDLSAVGSDDVGVIPEVFNSHLVLGESSGFIGADDRDGTECFHSRQFPDQGVAFQHPLRAERQRNCHHRR